MTSACPPYDGGGWVVWDTTDCRPPETMGSPLCGLTDARAKVWAEAFNVTEAVREERRIIYAKIRMYSKTKIW